tara:strand:- start:1496 stop:2167 length:672 start_codon:yes stop_codon:yes gene_type:complete
MSPQETNQFPNNTEVPEIVIARLPQYLRVLHTISDSGIDVISSLQLGKQMQVTPTQIRKDLSHIGRFGKQGKGYNVGYLATELQRVLGLNKNWHVCLIGIGRLGRAILNYPGFAPEGFQIKAAFDIDTAVIGQTIGGLTIQPIDDLKDDISKHNIKIGITAVPSNMTQKVVELLTSYGITSILNYAPMYPQVQPHIKVRNVDPVLALQSMTYYLNRPTNGAEV